MPERLECEVLQKARYINTLTFTFYRPHRCEHASRFPALLYGENRIFLRSLV